jgi:hypothetical protein
MRNPFAHGWEAKLAHRAANLKGLVILIERSESKDLRLYSTEAADCHVPHS